jgi:signal transduction histidine kinase
MRRIWGNTANYFVEMQDENDLKLTIQWLRDNDRNQQADETVQFIESTNLKQLYHPTIQLNNGRMSIDLLDAPTAEIETILEKMGAAFDLAYTRFFDLQKAESQTRQAKIETALEKVRARALAMQEPEELTEVAKVLRHEMGLLGVEELETCSIFIHDETMNRTECWYALKDSRSEEKKLVSDHFPLQLHSTWVGREMEKFYSADAKKVSILMQGTNRKEWINYCEEKSISLQGYYGEAIPDRTYHLYKFSHGAIGAASAGDISSESWDLLQRAASVFSLAYSRFKDLTQARFDLQRLKEEKQKAETALSELQTTQKQLIQSEKMASLGELTAGIAHEIQNPLNFVNNFSDVSTELIDEMNEELAAGNKQYAMGNVQEANTNLQNAMEIANDLKQNLEKINHHGKRAGDIVKGMLQHSRSSGATKEPTDINKLADEYLSLAYHGLRAKDKTFNATLKTDFDESIGNINIIPQDIGRVILNLITNAFYIVNEKSKQGIAGYEPTVEVSTKRIDSKIEISVKDNGNGIPESIKEKIFQPFFTTKPTGQGTGLGLSLSYDIVKAHGGELKVVTNEGEGSEFTIQLPTS